MCITQLIICNKKMNFNSVQEIGALFPFPGFIKRHFFDIQILLSFHHRLAVAKTIFINH